MVALGKIKRVALIDDELSQARILADLVKEFDLEPVLFTQGPYRTVSELVEDSMQVADAAICDHILSSRGLAQFDGAEAVAEFFRRDFPSVLVTQYFDPERVSIRQWRRWIPAVFDRQDASDTAEPLLIGLEKCAREIQGDVPLHRIPQRSMIEVAKKEADVMDVFVTNWKPQQAIRLPLGIVTDPLLRRDIHEGTLLIAYVNTGADAADDLYFSDFQLAPEP